MSNDHWIQQGRGLTSLMQLARVIDGDLYCLDQAVVMVGRLG